MGRFRPLRAFDRVDRRLLNILTHRERRHLDDLLTRLTHSANRSLLWILIAELLAAMGGRRGRRAALHGILAIGLSSAFVNGPLKFLFRRGRPEPRIGDRPSALRTPGSFSFPSGHASSAFAFAVGAGLEDPRLLLWLLPAAAGVAYSRIQLRVHYPFDVVAGAAIGASAAVAVGALDRAAREWRDSHSEAPVAERPPTTRAVIVFSSYAGRARKGLDRAQRAMADVGLTVIERLPVAELDRLATLLRGAGSPAPLVVAAGGDGTVGAVAHALVTETDAILGILPLGTSNDYARSLQIPMRPQHAARVLARGRVSTVDIGRLMRDGTQPRHFVHAATAGLNVNFARLATRTDLRRRLGRFTYAVAAVGAFRSRPVFRATLDYDGSTETAELIQLSVINAPVFGGILDLELPGIDPLDQRLDVILIGNLSLRRFLRSLFYPVFGVTRPIRGVRAVKVNRLRVETATPLDITLDGEVVGSLPGTFEAVGRGLRVVTPAAFTELDHS